jgi:hypothetical protein
MALVKLSVVSGMHHNVLGGFLDLRSAIFAAGSRSASEAKVPA